MPDLAQCRDLQRRFVKAFGKRDPWLAIVISALEGRGVNLSADETWLLLQDEAITSAAMNAAERLEEA